MVLRFKMEAGLVVVAAQIYRLHRLVLITHVAQMCRPPTGLWFWLLCGLLYNVAWLNTVWSDWAEPEADLKTTSPPLNQ